MIGEASFPELGKIIAGLKGRREQITTADLSGTGIQPPLSRGLPGRRNTQEASNRAGGVDLGFSPISNSKNPMESKQWQSAKDRRLSRE